MKVLVTTKEHLDREELMQLNKFPRLSVANVRIELAGTSGSAPQFPSKTVTTSMLEISYFHQDTVAQLLQLISCCFSLLNRRCLGTPGDESSGKPGCGVFRSGFLSNHSSVLPLQGEII